MKFLLTLLFALSLIIAPSRAQSQEAEKVKLLESAIKIVMPVKDSSQKLQVKAEDKIVAIGDSITAEGGYLRYSEQVLASIPELKSPKIINAGVSGHKAENMIARFDKDVIAKKPTIVTISVGINDVWHRLNKSHDESILKAYRENVIQMVEKSQGAGARVILLAPTLIQEDPSTEGNKRLPIYVKTLREIAVDRKCQFVDLHAMFLEALKHKPADKKGNWITSDGVHMAPLGKAVMALGLLRGLGVGDEISGAVEISLPAPKKKAAK